MNGRNLQRKTTNGVIIVFKPWHTQLTCWKLHGKPQFFGIEKWKYMHTDAHWSGLVSDWRTISGYCMFLSGNLIPWRSKKLNIQCRGRVQFYGFLWLKIILSDWRDIWKVLWNSTVKINQQYVFLINLYLLNLKSGSNFHIFCLKVILVHPFIVL